MQQFADVIGVVPDPEGASNQVAHPARGPGMVWKAVLEWTLSQEGSELFVLLGKETGRGSFGHCRLKGALLFETGFPTVDGVDRNAKILGDFFIWVCVTLDPAQSGEPTFFQLGTGQMGREPIGHVYILSRQSYAEINNSADVDYPLPLESFF